MSKIKPGDALAFRRLFDLLIKCQTVKYDISKDSGYLQDRCNRNALRIRSAEKRETGLLNFTNFIVDELILVNDPLLSKQAVVQYDEKPTKLQKF